MLNCIRPTLAEEKKKIFLSLTTLNIHIPDLFPKLMVIWYKSQARLNP